MFPIPWLSSTRYHFMALDIILVTRYNFTTLWWRQQKRDSRRAQETNLGKMEEIKTDQKLESESKTLSEKGKYAKKESMCRIMQVRERRWVGDICKCVCVRGTWERKEKGKPTVVGGRGRGRGDETERWPARGSRGRTFTFEEHTLLCLSNENWSKKQKHLACCYLWALV